MVLGAHKGYAWCLKACFRTASKEKSRNCVYSQAEQFQALVHKLHVIVIVPQVISVSNQLRKNYLLLGCHHVGVIGMSH